MLARSDGTPTYNFATVVDDGEMEMTHIIRGDDHLANTPRQILVFEALGYDVPRFAHLSMIWGEDGKKLSKRHGATSVEAYAEMGYLPESLLNYLALLGWSLDGETTIVTADVLKKEFSLERISKNPAIFDMQKLEWMNGTYIRDMAAEDFAARMAALLVDAELISEEDFENQRAWFVELAPLVSERIKLMTEVVPMVSFLFTDTVEIDEKSRTKVLEKEGALESLKTALPILESCEWTLEALDGALHTLPETLELKPRVVFQALRVAITGTMVSPPLFESIFLLERDRSVERVKAVIASLES